MKARLVAFPIKGRNWCFSRSADRTLPKSDSEIKSPSFKDLWKKISSGNRSFTENADITVDFAADKMNRAWMNLEKAPVGTFKNKLYGLGLLLLSRVKPSENFLKSISKDIKKVEVTFPTSLNPNLVRRRLRHIAIRGSIIHRQYFYGSLTLLPLTSVLMVLPTPNIPFFWISFRAYSHWQALKGSERLLLLTSNYSKSHSLVSNENGEIVCNDSEETLQNSFASSCEQEVSTYWRRTEPTYDIEHGFGSSDHNPYEVLLPSEELEKLLYGQSDEKVCVNEGVVSEICKAHDLDKKEVLKYRKFNVV